MAMNNVTYSLCTLSDGGYAPDNVLEQWHEKKLDNSDYTLWNVIPDKKKLQINKDL